MRLLLLLIINTGCLLLNFAHCSEDEMLPRIGIVGAGIGGTSAAYYLRQLFGEKTIIDIFETDKPGGRAALINIDGQEYEAGGSIIHNRNKYMVDFAEKFNKSADRNTAAMGLFGLYSDSGIIFETSKWSALTALKLLWRYGLDLYTVQEYTKNMLQKFDRIYDFQDKGMAFTTVEDMLRAMSDDFVNMTKHSFSSVLRDAGVSQKFIDELAMAALRNNYGQTTDTHGFVGLVSLVGAEPGLWSVKNGNRLLAVDLLQESKAHFIQSVVSNVVLVKDELGSGSVTYEVEYIKANSDDKENMGSREYDILIIATPVFGTKYKINFVNFPNPVTSFSQDFHTTIAMFVQGQINQTTFNLNSPDEFPPDLFCISPDIYFNSIGKQTPAAGQKETSESGQTVWKTFLNKVPSEEKINRLFSSRTDLRLVDWLAYPQYKPGMDLPPFMLYDRLYYVNAVESAASAMEMSAIGARNVALLAFNQWQGNFEKIDELHLPSEAKIEDEKSEL